MKKVIIGLFATLIASHTYADGTNPTKIVYVESYNQYGVGDVVFKVENPTTECIDGYWLNKLDAGYQANFAMIISGFHTRGTVVVNALPDQLWAGSRAKYCKLYSIDFRM